MRATTGSKDAGNDWRSFWTFSTRVTNERVSPEGIWSQVEMIEEIDDSRRHFLATVAMTLGAAQFAMIGPAAAQTGKTRRASLPASKPGTDKSFGPLKQIDAGLLNVGYAEMGSIFDWGYGRFGS